MVEWSIDNPETSQKPYSSNQTINRRTSFGVAAQSSSCWPRNSDQIPSTCWKHWISDLQQSLKNNRIKLYNFRAFLRTVLRTVLSYYFLRLSLCLFVSLSLCLSVALSLCLSVSLSLFFSVSLSLFLSSSLSLCLTVSVSLSLFLSVSISLCLSPCQYMSFSFPLLFLPLFLFFYLAFLLMSSTLPVSSFAAD